MANAGEAERFKQEMRDSLRHETLNSRAVTIPRHANVYNCGDQDEKVYFIETSAPKSVPFPSRGYERGRLLNELGRAEGCVLIQCAFGPSNYTVSQSCDGDLRPIVVYKVPALKEAPIFDPGDAHSRLSIFGQYLSARGAYGKIGRRRKRKAHWHVHLDHPKRDRKVVLGVCRAFMGWRRGLRGRRGSHFGRFRVGRSENAQSRSRNPSVDGPYAQA